MAVAVTINAPLGSTPLPIPKPVCKRIRPVRSMAPFLFATASYPERLRRVRHLGERHDICGLRGRHRPTPITAAALSAATVVR